MKTETTTNKKTNWSEKDSFLEERGRTLLTVLDDVRENYEDHPEFYYIRWGILKAFNSINEIRESMFEIRANPIVFAKNNIIGEEHRFVADDDNAEISN